jgi:hypothetical protein
MVRTFLLVWLAQLVCGCTPHEVRCDGHLEPINRPAAPPGTGLAPGAASLPGVQ